MSASNTLSSTPIAIVGMACIFPQAKDLTQYWDNIVKEVDCITDIPSSRWRAEDYFDPDPKAPDKTYCKRGGFIPEIDFDPTEFGLPPNILEITDVSQLLSLVVAREAMEDAGYGEGKTFDRDRVGVILGVGGGQKLIVPLASRLQAPIWRQVLESSGLSEPDADKIVEKIKAAYIPWQEDSFPGLLGNVIAGRIASRLDLGGTNCVVDAACAASLSAAKMAISDLIEGRSDMIITGGVDTDNSIFMYMCFSKTPASTPGTHAKPFDANSDGILIGEGIGMLILKRLEDAQRDDDRIYAVIRGIGTSSDGRSKSIYAPREAGQAKALKRAYEDANIAPETVSLIEAHGTGTRAGDICEVTALKEVFANGKTQQIALGSVKSQIGHTKSAAGAAGLIKTALALHHKVLPPTLHIETPNPRLGLDTSPIYLNTQTRPWFRASDQHPRRAGVSAFGFGGTNFHFVLEEYDAEPNGAYRLQQVPRTILLHADTPPNLLARLEKIGADLQSENAEPCFLDLANTCRSLEIPATSPRIGFVASSVAEACDLLAVAINGLKTNDADWENPKGVFYRASALPEGAKIVALFPGQGSQYVGMGRELTLNFPELRRAWESMDSLFVEAGLEPLSRTAFPPPAFDNARRAAQAKTLQRTEHAQPAIGTFSAGLYKLLQAAGFQPDFVAGHSFGELTALWAAGVFSDSDFLALARARGAAMASPDNSDAGAMLAVRASTDEIEAALGALPDILVANDNADRQVVIAGPTDSIGSAQQTLETKGISSILLPVSAAFHTPLVAHAQQPFSDALKTVTFHSPHIPIYANTTAEPYPDHAQSARKLLREHLLKPVRFREQIEKIYADGGFYFVEIGPRNVLTNLVKKILKNRPHLAVALNSAADRGSDYQLPQAILQLRIAGLPLKDADPYRRDRTPSNRKNKMNVRLSGHNFVSEKTRERFDRALQDEHRIQIPNAEPAPSTNNPAPGADNRTQVQSHAVSQGETMSPTPTDQATSIQNPELRQRMVESLERSLTQFYNLQAETLRVHEQYLQGQMEYARTFFQLIQQQYALLGQPQLGPSLQATVPPVQPVIPQQPVIPPPPVNLLQNGGLVVPPPQFGAIPPAAPAVQQQPISYAPPPPTAPPHSNAPAQPPAQLAVPTAEQPVVAPLPEDPPADGPARYPAPATDHSTAPTGSLDVETLTRSMMAIVSEKTGYPEDVLEPDMDIEADLGIDSIKRVEILGAMLETHPELPQVNPEDLAELQTLAQIVEYMKNQAHA
ncbi:MAG: beta-ketoacyl synthase N-terminal-like domain-containing protein [bacterium]|nr:beta-ketoacyl synthase N-terminal-like domain-containing protein [bacterium]